MRKSDFKIRGLCGEIPFSKPPIRPYEEKNKRVKQGQKIESSRNMFGNTG